MKNSIDRLADLHYAYQWGQESVCGVFDEDAQLQKFLIEFPSDSEAMEHYEAGVKWAKRQGERA